MWASCRRTIRDHVQTRTSHSSKLKDEKKGSLPEPRKELDSSGCSDFLFEDIASPTQPHGEGTGKCTLNPVLPFHILSELSY